MAKSDPHSRKNQPPAFKILIAEAARVGTGMDDPSKLILKVTALREFLDQPDTRSARQAYGEVVEMLAELLAVHHDPGAVGRLLGLVGDLLGGYSIHDMLKPRRNRKDVKYTQRDGRHGPELIESRPGSSKPFIVGREDYDAGIKALGDCAIGTRATYKELQAAFVRHGGADLPSAYQLRVILRFLQRCDPRVVDGIRNGYRAEAKTRKSLERGAKQAFESLPEFDRSRLPGDQ